MTHEELLAEIGDNSERTNNALRAVVELHKPEMTSFDLGPQYLACSHCIESTNDRDYKVDYPCPTIQAIKKELE